MTRPTIGPTTTIEALCSLAGVDMGNVSSIEIDPLELRVTTVVKRHTAVLGSRVITQVRIIPIRAEGFV